ncbi:glutamate-cysteine ligase family protein [Micromonospora sp. NPDC050397]|uniref:glutamate-cysteine ligase family protein n=1 Tax=Micromonospora sp. NPDC050397 TaxID=3364279 RepID=UPI00384B553B
MSHGLVQYDEPPLDLADLVGWFISPAKTQRLVGLEVECGLVRPQTGTSVSYDEPGGTRDLLHALLDTTDATPVLEGGALVGLALPDGATLTLEMAGAIEYSSPPSDDLTGCLALSRRCLTEVARTAEPLGLRLLTGGQLPFDRPEDISWTPKVRTAIMRRYFARLGDHGRLGDQVMGLTLSTQVSLDALDPVEYLDKFRVLVAVSPFLAALLANTPALDPGTAPVASRRMRYWRRIDPERCQDLTRRLYQAGSLAELTDVLAALPMIYRRAGDAYLPGPQRSFGKLLHGGFPDGVLPTIADWKTHLGQIWPSVRPRQTLETRLPDGQDWAGLGVLPALFVGLVEEEEIRRRVGDLVGDLPVETLDEITLDAAEEHPDGIPARVREIGEQLVGLACEGLLARVAKGVELPTILDALEPVREVLATGVTPATELAARWAKDWQERPDRYVAAMAVPTE